MDSFGGAGGGGSALVAIQFLPCSRAEKQRSLGICSIRAPERRGSSIFANFFHSLRHWQI